MNQQNQLGENPFVMALGLAKDAAQSLLPMVTTPELIQSYGICDTKRNEDMLKLLLDNGADPTASINKALQLNNVGMMKW